MGSRQNASMVHVLNKDLMFRAYNRVLRPHEVWNVGVVHEPIQVFLEPGARPRVEWFPQLEENSFLADPFAVVRDEKVYVFCEAFDRRVSKGKIVWVELADGVRSSKPNLAIQLPIHVSHPYLFQHQGEIYCIPETYQGREIALYKSNRFPSEWEKVCTLIQGIAGLDSTVFRFEDNWWLTCLDNDVNPLDRLFVWYSRDLLGPWIPHSANPVKIDIRSCRPAGTPFMYNDRLYRPAMDCSRTYGRRVVLNRIVRLTPRVFEEAPEVVIEPYADSAYPHGIHTLSAAGGITLVDGKRLCFLKSGIKNSLGLHFVRE